MPRWRSKIKRTLGTKSREHDTHEQDYRYPPKPDSYYDVKEITIKDLSKWPNGVWSAAPSDTGIITKRPQVLAFRKWQKDLYETNLKKA